MLERIFLDIMRQLLRTHGCDQTPDEDAATLHWYCDNMTDSLDTSVTLMQGMNTEQFTVLLAVAVQAHAMSQDDSNPRAVFMRQAFEQAMEVEGMTKQLAWQNAGSVLMYLDQHGINPADVVLQRVEDDVMSALLERTNNSVH